MITKDLTAIKIIFLKNYEGMIIQMKGQAAQSNIVKLSNQKCNAIEPQTISEDITEEDESLFLKIVSTDLDEKQIERITNPEKIFPHQTSVLAVHWHPEFVPMKFITTRINRMFPNRDHELIIPTQHNQIMVYGDYAGVEVDCYSSGFNQKVQLLLHFKKDNLNEATVLNNMLAHTYKYRSTQLFEFIDTITNPIEERICEAVRQTGTSDFIVNFVKINVQKIKMLLDKHMGTIPDHSIKNKLLRNYFDCLRNTYGDDLINRVQVYLQVIKQIVKQHFPFVYFYRTSEVIEEARSLNAGILIPHPEQFWPILLANYDVDGVEVWNPQSQRYTNFLISVLNQKREKQKAHDRDLLIFMGDDTHMSEKTLEPKDQNPEKGNREIGYQPAWDDLDIRKNLIINKFNRRNVIEEYKKRLN